MNPDFWHHRRVLVTGHTGFKGSWLSLWLQRLGASTAGYALEPPTRPNLFELADVGSGMRSHHGDVRNLPELERVMQEHRPEIVFHLAAQPIVRQAYRDPLDTFGTNALGTATLLEAVRRTPGVRAVVAITSDKCYDNVEWVWGYREDDRLGGHDPYSASKACAELIIDSYRRSFFPPDQHDTHGVAVASTRAGNVIGGGDWSPDRLVPDVLDALHSGRKAELRNPGATRPWQHVLEPLSGYIMLAERLVEDGGDFAQAWNFGPAETSIRSVAWITEHLHRLWGREGDWQLDGEEHPHENTLLRLDSSKARARLGWQPRLELETALAWIVDWSKAHHAGRCMREVTLEQIRAYGMGSEEELVGAGSA